VVFMPNFSQLLGNVPYDEMLPELKN